MTTGPILLLENVSRVHGHDETEVRALDGVPPARRWSSRRGCLLGLL